MGRCVQSQVVGALLEGEDEAVVVVAEGRRPLQDRDVRQPVQLGDRGGDPVERRDAVDHLGTAEQRAAGFRLLVDEDHPRPGAGCRQRGGDAGRPRADDQDVAVRVDGVVPARVGTVGEPALAGQAARHEAVEQLDGGGGQHRLGEGRLDLHQRVGVLGARGHDAAGPAELDAGRDLVDAVGQQRRGERVAPQALVGTAVEGEGQRGVAVHAAALGAAEGGAHAITGFGSSRR